MVANNGNNEGLFRGAFMQSGAPIPIGNFTHGQRYFDDIVFRTGCDGATEKLNCLRRVPFASLRDAINASPGVFVYQVFLKYPFVTWVTRLTHITQVPSFGVVALSRWRFSHR